MIRRKDLYKEDSKLTVTKHFDVRFSEVDSLGIVWHGNYIIYFEDGREAFGQKHGISYLDVQVNGFTTPIVKSVCEHKLPLKYGESARIETTFVDSPAAKIIFRFRIYNSNNQLVCFGESTQVFLDKDGNLVLNPPPFFEEWKQKVGLL